MHYIVRPGFKAKEDRGLIRLFHLGTVEEKDISVAQAESIDEAPRAIPIRAKLPSTARYPNALGGGAFDSRGSLATRSDLITTHKKKTKFLWGFGLLVAAAIGYAAFVYNTAIIAALPW